MKMILFSYFYDFFVLFDRNLLLRIESRNYSSLIFLTFCFSRCVKMILFSYFYDFFVFFDRNLLLRIEARNYSSLIFLTFCFCSLKRNCMLRIDARK